MRRFVLEINIEADTIEAVRDALNDAAYIVVQDSWENSVLTIFGSGQSVDMNGSVIDTESK